MTECKDVHVYSEELLTDVDLLRTGIMVLQYYGYEPINALIIFLCTGS